MATLHTVNKSPFATRALISCIGHASDGDTILMIEDGVYGAASGTGVADALAARDGAVTLCALEPDLKARGIDAARLLGGVKTVNYTGFVELAANHDLTHAWL
ncbi:MAG: sulfurtransferase complex subunit TusB [Rhodobacteraceae bacterium]|nr:sulfurtransferase complex subunit TusB [Paracoccaceae bacterium]